MTMCCFTDIARQKCKKIKKIYNVVKWLSWQQRVFLDYIFWVLLCVIGFWVLSQNFKVKWVLVQKLWTKKWQWPPILNRVNIKLYNFTPDKLDKVLKSTKNKKAARLDNIPPETWNTCTFLTELAIYILSSVSLSSSFQSPHYFIVVALVRALKDIFLNN